MSYKAEYIKTVVIKWLLDGNLSFDPSKDAIGAEVLFSINKRRSDLLVLSEQFHALEIKGDFDNLKKLDDQLDDYHKTFDMVSIITTPKHIYRASKIIKPSTGLIIFDNEMLKVKRPARRRKQLDKDSLLMFLNKPELNALFKAKNIRDFSTDELRRFIATKLSVSEIRNTTHLVLRKRYGKLFRLFLSDTGGNIVYDDLKGLCGRIEKLHA